MRSILRKWEDLWVAVAFAEAGEMEISAKFAGSDIQERSAAAAPAPVKA